MNSDEEIFDGAEPVVEEKEPEPTEETTGEKEDEVKADAETESTAESEDSQEEVSSPDTEEQTVTIKALHGERDRRKAAELRAKELEEQLSQNQKKDPTSVFEDENTFRSEISEEIRSQVVQSNLALTERFARRIHGDEAVDNAISWFKEAADSSPTLLKKFHDSGNDVDEVVNLYNKHLEAEKMNDIDAYKAQLKAEALAEAKKELEAEQAKKDELRDSIPESLTEDASIGSRKAKPFEEPSDEELFG